MKHYLTEIRKSVSRAPAIPNMVRDSVHKNSLEKISPDPVQSSLPRLDLPQAAFESTSGDRMDKIHLILQGLTCQQERTLESQPADLVTFTCKVTIASGSVDYQLKMLNFELYIYIKARLVQKFNKLAILHNNQNRY